MVWTDKVNQVLLTEQVDLLVSSQRLLAGEWHVKPASTGHVHLNKQQTHDKSLHPFQKTKQHISAWSNTNTRQKLTPKMTDPVSLNKQHMTKVCTSEAQALLSWANNTWQKPASQKHKLCYPEQTRRKNSQHLTNTGLVILNKQHVKTVQSNMVSMCADDWNKLKFLQCCMTSDFSVFSPWLTLISFQYFIASDLSPGSHCLTRWQPNAGHTRHSSSLQW